MQHVQLICLVEIIKMRSTLAFFLIWIFFHEHSPITGMQAKGEGISLTPQYHFHPLHRHLHISWSITAEGVTQHIAGIEQLESNWKHLVSDRKSLNRLKKFKWSLEGIQYDKLVSITKMLQTFLRKAFTVYFISKKSIVNGCSHSSNHIFNIQHLSEVPLKSFLEPLY